MPIALLNHVTLRYGDVPALDDVSLEVARGEWVCVLGANGSGKSTLASVLAGLIAPDEGDVGLAGQAALTAGKVDAEAYRAARRHVGLVFQNPDDQIVTTVVEDDVAFGPENLGVPAELIGERVRRELHRVAMDDFAQADPTKLSGGQKQRVAIAGALAMEPSLLVLDEPGALLDVRGRAAILRVMGRLRDAGTALVHITHFMEEALAADRVVVLSHGKVALQGTPAEVFAHADELMALGLDEPFAARLSAALREKGADVAWTCDEDVLAERLVGLRSSGVPGGRGVPEGRPGWGEPGGLLGWGEPGGLTWRASDDAESLGDVTAPSLPARPSAGDVTAPDLVVSHVCYSYHGGTNRLALNDVSFAVRPGTRTALIGQTGSGKSTLLRLLCALEAPDRGEIRVLGTPTSRARDRRTLHGRVGYVMQHPERQLFAETVREDVAYGPSNLGLSSAEVNARVTEALKVVGLAGREGASPFDLSGGQQRLCALAGVLAMEPRVLLLDEPTAGLDPRGRAQLREVLARVGAQGVTLVEVTHDMGAAARADEIVVLDRSRVALVGTPHEVFSPDNEEALREVGLGLPNPLAFARRLERAGWPALGDPLTTLDLADAIARAGLGEGGEATWR